jgi:hypothetical protein
MRAVYMRVDMCISNYLYMNIVDISVYVIALLMNNMRMILGPGYV